MTPVYLNPPPSSPIPFIEFKGGDLVANNFSYSSLDNKTHVSDHLHEGLAIEYSWNPQDKVDKVLSYDHKSNDVVQASQSSTWPQNYMMDGSGCSYGHSSNPNSHGKIKIVTNNIEQKNSKKWKPSKVRIMQKMLTTSKNMGDHKVQHDPEQRRSYQSNLYRNNSSNNNNNNNNGVRVCVDCHTTTTPLWRSGPQGPKTLCNACGIRQRKARRAAMAAAAQVAELANDGIVSSPSSVSMEVPKPKVHDQEERATGLHHGGNHHTLPLKKRGKITFEDATPPMNNNNNNSWSHSYINAKSQRAFPRDEEEGAILLMALSCGLACSS